MAIKDNNIVKIAMQYWLDGDSLAKSLAQAQKQYQASNAKSKAISEKEAKAQMDLLIKYSKLTLAQINRQNKVSASKELQNNRKNVQKAWDNRKSIRKKGLADEVAAEKKAEAQKTSNRKKSFSGGFDNFGGKLGTISSYGAAIAVINAVRQAITYTITKVIEFEEAFIDLAVKSGYTNKEMASVSEEVYNVAAATKFSTTEIISAATALGKLGFEANEVIEILPNVANVAGATGESLENTAKIFGKVMNAYSLIADQSQYVADLMVDTFNNSALDMEKFNTAFSYVGAAASSTGTSLTELTKAMAILSDRGVTASKIGTGLRNIFTKLGREGDTLRGIIARVNEENLSFYEIAELVGRRAANQLFILMDKIEDFDKAILDSANSFGAAWEANAKQMSSFSAKWDIFVNNITNKAAGIEFDEDRTFRASLNESIDLMTKLNALKLFNKDGDDIAVFNIAAQDKEFLKLLSDTDKELKEINFEGTNQEREDAIRNIIYNKIEEGFTDVEIKAARTGQPSTAGKVGSDSRKRAKQLSEERRGVSKYFNLSKDGDSVLKLIDEYNKGFEANKLSLLKEQYQSNLTSIVDFVSQFKTESTNAFNDAIKEGDESTATKILQSLIDKGLADEGRMKILKNVFKNNQLLTEEMKNDIRNKSLGTGMESVLAEGVGYRTISNELSGGTNSLSGVLKNDVKRFDKAVSDRKAWEADICNKAKTDSAYNWVIRQAGVTCPVTGSRSRADIGEFQKNIIDEQAYRVKKDELTKQYSNEDDPIKKLGINNKLVSLEEDYRANLIAQYQAYFEKQASIREEFKRKYPKQINDFDENIESTKRASVKDMADRQINFNTYDNRDLEAKAEAYKQDIIKKTAYKKKTAEIDLELRGLDKKNTKDRKVLLDERNKITKDYYDDAEKDFKSHYDNLKDSLNRLNITNIISKSFGLETIDTAELEQLIAELESVLNKLGADRANDTKTGNKNDREDFDYFPVIMDMSNNVYDAYAMAGDLKLELLQEQTEKELELIQDRFDGEQAIVSAALSSGIISQEQAYEAEEKLRKKKIDDENKANKKLFEAQKKRDKEDAIFQGLAATAQAVVAAFAKGNPIAATIMASISAAAIAAGTAMNINAISKRKFVPQKYADGGFVYGKSHAEGGVPFTVAGRGGYEMEGGEFIVNKESAKEHIDELVRINNKTQTSKRKFATGGSIDTVSDKIQVSEELLEALNRPVRAFVTDQDLATSESERNALTLKTSY